MNEGGGERCGYTNSCEVVADIDQSPLFLLQSAHIEKSAQQSSKFAVYGLQGKSGVGTSKLTGSTKKSWPNLVIAYSVCFGKSLAAFIVSVFAEWWSKDLKSWIWWLCIAPSISPTKIEIRSHSVFGLYRLDLQISKIE
jgi:hypothetical protein